MMQTELVTIVIPTFEDDPEHLREAVASAAAQTHPRLDAIIVDDESTRPETLVALRELEKSVTVVRQPNRDPSAARNAGIRAGTGELLICLDADDALSPTYAAESVQVLSGAGEASVVYPRMEPFGGPGDAWPTRRARALVTAAVGVRGTYTSGS